MSDKSLSSSEESDDSQASSQSSSEEDSESDDVPMVTEVNFPASIIDKLFKDKHHLLDGLQNTLKNKYKDSENQTKFDQALKAILDQVSSQISLYPTQDQTQLLQELSYLIFEFIKGDLSPKIGKTSGSLYQSCLSNYRLTAFFKYLQANLLNNAPSRNKFTTCCQIIGHF